MKISDFFIEVLGAQLKNTRWSWGARDGFTNRVYLRVWRDQIHSGDGVERVMVGYVKPSRRSPGFPERNLHVRMIEHGAEGFGVVCTAVDPDTREARKIASFDEHELLRLGDIRRHGDVAYAEVLGRVPVDALARPQATEAMLADDIRAIARRKVEATQKEALISARIGQGAFRADVLRLWGGRCAVTGSSVPDAIRASHIKPWKDSDDRERLDPANGLPLVATLDALFDAGLVSFAESGEMLFSKRLDEHEKEILALRPCRLRQPVSIDVARYLEFHRKHILRR